jgi:DHA2 family multidrug resistance protein
MESGIVLMPRGLAMAVLMPIVGRWYNALGPRVMVGAGLAVSAFSFFQLSHLTVDVGYWDLFWPQLWQGVGFALIFVALSTAALAAIEKPKMTAAAGLYNVVRQVFGSVGIALAATQLTSGTNTYRAHLVEKLTPGNPITRGWMQGVTAGMQAAGADAYTASRRALALLDGDVMRQAAVLAYNHVFVLVAILFSLSLPLVLLLRAAKATGEPMEIIAD